MPTFRRLGIFVSVSCLLSSGAGLVRGAPLGVPRELAGRRIVRHESLPVVPLRGYKSLGGEFAEYANSAGTRSSLLTIACADAEVAGIVLAKYRSDLRCLGGVRDAQFMLGPHTAPLAQVDGQGVLVAFRHGVQVLIVAAEEQAELANLLAALPLPDFAQLDFQGAAEVPMFLDKFDRFGWSFWYAPLTAPPNQAATYDFRQDYDYAKQMGVGLQLQINPSHQDTAEGIIDTAQYSWAVNLARQKGVPVFLQPMLTGPMWVRNLYPQQMQLRMPQYVGNYYSPGTWHGGDEPAQIAWSAIEAKEAMLSPISKIVRRYRQYPNVTGYLEPHNELEHNMPAMFSDYGEVADAAFRTFLQERYQTPQAVDQRWHGGRGVIKTWQEVRVPEVASFLGWNQRAKDLQGTWRVAGDEKLSAEQLERWASPQLEDAGWAQLVAPGDDRAVRWPHQPAVYRRTFELSAAELAALQAAGEGRIYLYVWDLEQLRGEQKIVAALNGEVAGEFQPRSHLVSWCVLEVSKWLRAGSNLLALRLPTGHLSYRVYLSPDAPVCYPQLGRERNCLWVDVRDFTTWTREQSVRRGMEAIRREDPDKFIKLMSPVVADAMKVVAEEYGGAFHDTGSMSSWWNDYRAAVMRSSGLPFTIEPGNGAPDLRTLKLFFGHWSTEGVNAVDYFQNLGEITWAADLKAWFEAHQPLVHLFGKYHGGPAAVAVLHGARSSQLGGYPWSLLRNEALGMTRLDYAANPVEQALPYPRDILVERDFARGRAEPYRVIFDANTVFMDQALVEQIADWVRRGGTFVTCSQGQTGRHTPEEADAWPISRLTGYRVRRLGCGGPLKPAPGQSLLVDRRWQTEVRGNGMVLERVLPECQDVLLWAESGGVAVGLRPLGKGYVVHLAASFPDNYSELLRWRGIENDNPRAEGCRVVPFVSNNGLYHVYTLWAERLQAPQATTLVFPGPHAPESLRDVLSGATLQGTTAEGSRRFSPLALAPLDTRAYLAPRRQLAGAPLDWLQLQRAWWKGTRRPAPAPTFTFPNTLDLSQDWAFTPLPADAVDGSALAGSTVEDRTWKRLDLGIWSFPDFPDEKRGLFRKRFTIPAAWSGQGQCWLWIIGAGPVTLRPPYKVRAYLDGKLIWTSGQSPWDFLCRDLTRDLPAGEHVLAVEAEGTTTVAGLVGEAWIEFIPEPARRQSLAGDWGDNVHLPGQAVLPLGTKRKFVPDPAGKGKDVVLYVEGPRADIACVYINGRRLNRSAGMMRGHHFRINLLPWLKWDAENELELEAGYRGPHDVMHITQIELRYYEPERRQAAFEK